MNPRTFILDLFQSVVMLVKGCGFLQITGRHTYDEYAIKEDITPRLVKNHVQLFDRTKAQLNAKSNRYKDVTTRKPARGKHRSF